MIENTIKEIQQTKLSPLDLLAPDDVREKLIELVLKGVPRKTHPGARQQLEQLRQQLLDTPVDDAKVVVFGGGTGLSNIIGGDSRQKIWVSDPFNGLKKHFPKTRSVVCVTDSGGSTGELLKDLDLIAIGDIRHVLLSSVQLSKLQKKYNLDKDEAKQTVNALAGIFNWRFKGPLNRMHPDWSNTANLIAAMPASMKGYFEYLVNYLFTDPGFKPVLKKSHCFGNLLVAASIYRELEQQQKVAKNHNHSRNLHRAILRGLDGIGGVIGTEKQAVMPCTSTSAQLRIRYTNGVEITGEHKLSSVKRGVPVDLIKVDYVEQPLVYKEVIHDIAEAELIVLAPGSLYSSIIPVFKVPGLAEAVRNNKSAVKILISNLWVQAGETDLSIVDPKRKFHVSDMIRAYEENIPGGTRDLFHEILCVSLREIPASILQSYAVEGKIPIYLDKDKLARYDFSPVECDIFSINAINNRGVIQHDPENLALAIKALFNGRSSFFNDPFNGSGVVKDIKECAENTDKYTNKIKKFIKPYAKHAQIIKRLGTIRVEFVGVTGGTDSHKLKNDLAEILWNHPIIPLEHLKYFKGIHCIAPSEWNRDQKWDNVFSFFDPDDSCIKIRADQLGVRENLEVALMIAIGESLLGDYAEVKYMEKVVSNDIELGRVYHLHLREEHKRKSFLTSDQLNTFLGLSRMCTTNYEKHFTRLVNRGEGFTPPGLLMGLMYAWYIDNRLATHIEYKMSVLKIDRTDLIPEQLRMAEKRRKMIDFFREVIFKGD